MWFDFHQNWALPKMSQCFGGPQVMKTRLEADEVAAQLERCDKENKILKDEMNKEIEAVLPPFCAFFRCPSPCLLDCPSCSPSPSLLWTRINKFSLCWAGPFRHMRAPSFLISTILCFFFIPFPPGFCLSSMCFLKKSLLLYSSIDSLASLLEAKGLS